MHYDPLIGPEAGETTKMEPQAVAGTVRPAAVARPCAHRARRLLSALASGAFMPWAFSSREVEAWYQAERAAECAQVDPWVAFPWALLFISIIKRLAARTLGVAAIAHSFCHFLVIISPCYLQALLGRERYLRHRNKILVLALAGYAFHPGGGLYRDATVAAAQNEGAEATLLGAAALFVRCLVASRALFWGFLVSGYRMPPHIGAPVQLALGSALMWLRPSQPLCAALQTPARSSLFRLVANAIPLLTLVPIGRPELGEGADVCNPLIYWLQIGFGFMLPLAVQLCADWEARRRFASRNSRRLPTADRARWLSVAVIAGGPRVIALMIITHLLTALWFFLVWLSGQADAPAAACPAPSASYA
eukprot:scaffold4.g4789.t1